ncbi:MAG TPA: WXG100 family type VII secretion target [Dermatophilaceae bacterium]|nr:WXG100 family type VII secretion target [Dermatophilaceae bacterium]
MGTQFQVDTQQIQAAAAEITRISAQIDADVAAMMMRLTSLQDAWRGAAAMGFQGVVTSWSGTQRHVKESLDQIRLALSRAGDRYAEVEAVNTTLFHG